MYNVGDTVYFLRDNSLIIDVCDGVIVDCSFTNYALVKTKLSGSVIEQVIYTRRLYKTKESAIQYCVRSQKKRLENLKNKREVLENQIYLISLNISKLSG